MAYTSVSERDYLLATAKHLRAALDKHRDEVKKFGATDANIKKLDQAMQAVDVPGVDISPAQRAYEEGRETLKDSYRLFRDCARGVASGIEGDDPAAGKALLAHQNFPESDGKLVSHCQTVAEGFRKYGARLAACGFGKDEQEHLKQSTAALEKLAGVLRRDKTVRTGSSKERAASVARLRRCIKFLRDAGKRAFRDTPQAADFAPLTKGKRAKAAAAPGNGAPARQEAAPARA
jgi:hypothetical protein